MGVGFNVNSDLRRHPDLHSIATSLRCENEGHFIVREQLLATFCNYIEEFLTYKHDVLYRRAMDTQLFDRGRMVRVTNVKEGVTFRASVQEISPGWLITVKGTL